MNTETVEKSIDFLLEITEMSDWDKNEFLSHQGGAHWNLHTTNINLYDRMMRDPEYFAKSPHNIDIELVWMSPAKYFKLCSQAMGVEVERLQRKLSSELVSMYARMIETGVKFPILVVDFVKNTQEGLHRAAATEKAKYSQVPVLVIRKIERTT